MANDDIEGKNKIIFIWKIENFSFCALKRGEYLVSPSFFIDMPDETEWKFWIYPNGDIEENEKYVGMYLQRKNGGKADGISVGYQLQILNTEGLPETSKTVDNHSFEKSRAYGFPAYISKNDLYVVQRKSLLHNDCLILRARIWKTDGNLTESSHCFALTRMHREAVSFYWTVEKIGSITADDRETFKASKKTEKSPQITADLSLHGEPCCSKNLKIQVRVKDTSKQVKIIFASISLLDSKNKKVFTKKDEIRLNSKDGTATLILPCFYSKITEKYVTNDALRFYAKFVSCRGVVYEALESCITGPKALMDESDYTKDILIGKSFEEFESPGEPKDCEIPEKAEESEDAEKSNNLSHDIQSMHRESLLSDVTLRVGPRSFSAHRALLSARSPVFRAMFCSDMREGAEGTVRIEDIEGDTLQRLLDFIYTDSVGDLQVETAANLYFAADKYEVPLLRKLCFDFLLGNICVENACDLLVLADAHGDDRFKSSVVSFIVEHCAEVCGTEAWGSLMKSQPSLAAEAMLQKILKG